MKMKMSELDWAAWIFVIIGAMNWGLYGLFKLDAVQIIFSTSPYMAMFVYILIGSAGVYWFAKLFGKMR